MADVQENHGASVEPSARSASQPPRLPKPIPTWLRLTLIAYFVGGGFAGFVATSDATFGGQIHTALTTTIYVAFALLYALSVAIGLVLVTQPRRLTLACAMLILQIPVISSPPVCYQFASVVHATVGYSDSNLILFSEQFGGDWRFSFGQSVPWSVGVNLVPIILLIAMADRNYSFAKHLSARNLTPGLPPK